MNLFFETHATSAENELHLASGHHDTPLSRRSEDEARALGPRYPHIECVYCSDLQRSWRTAEIAFAARSVTITRTPLLRECDYGACTGRPTSQVHSRRSHHLAAPWPDGESYTDVANRVRVFLDSLRRDQDILVIGHRATWYALEHLLRGIPLADAVAQEWQWPPPRRRYRI